MAAADNDDYLQQVLNFTPADLALNRAGQLSAAQAAHLHTIFRQYSQASRTVILVVMALTFGLLVIAGLSLRSQVLELLKTETGLVLLVPGGVLAIWFVLVVLALVRRPRVDADTPVKLAQGVVKVRDLYRTIGPTYGVSAGTGPEAITHRVQIERLSFYVSAIVAQGFVPGRMYQAYYIQYTRGRYGRWLVAAETG